MDIAKFVSLLEKKSLFFSKPSNFKDPWEGYFTKRHYDSRSYENLSKEIGNEMISSAKKTTEMVREEVGVNCWHINDCESEAFWRLYSNKGIVIQSTFGRLKKSFNVDSVRSIYIGTIEYKDPDVDLVNLENMFNAILWKRKSFSYENELRAVIWSRENRDGKGPVPFETSRGQFIPIDINTLVENIHTSPFEKDNWFNKLVIDIIKRYGYDFVCNRSTLLDHPDKRL